MSDSFEALGIQPWLASQCAALALTKPTEVQKACIPYLLSKLGTNVVGGAVTGSGKTAAFALPILQLLSEEMYGVFALVLTPSRELAYQIIDQFIAFGAPVAVRTAIVIGGVHHSKQLEAIVTRPHVVVATPGRLRMLLETFPEVILSFKNLRYLVLDEADRLTEGDIQEDVFECIKLLGPKKQFRQTVLMSATIDSRLTTFSEGILEKLGITEQESVKVCICGAAETTNQGICATYQIAPNLDQKYIFVPNFVKLPYTVALLKTLTTSESAIIFCNSCFRSEVLRLTLQLLGFPVCSLNSLLLQQHRLNNLAIFKSGIAKILVATDIAARGLDIPDVDMVVHYDFPKMSSTYVHRVGRTARAGKAGISIAITTENDVSLVHKIERKTRSKLTLFKHTKVNDDVVEAILDEISIAKVEAKLQVETQFGNRAATLKRIGQERKGDINKAIRDDWDVTMDAGRRTGRTLQQMGGPEDRSVSERGIEPQSTERRKEVVNTLNKRIVKKKTLLQTKWKQKTEEDQSSSMKKIRRIEKTPKK